MAALEVFIAFVSGAEGGDVEDSSQGKMQIKSGQSKLKNRKHGYVVMGFSSSSLLDNGAFGKVSSAIF